MSQGEGFIRRTALRLTRERLRQQHSTVHCRIDVADLCGEQEEMTNPKTRRVRPHGAQYQTKSTVRLAVDEEN